MVEMIKDAYGSEEYIVRYDVDGNGRADDVAFQEEAAAKDYEDCYVKKDRNACESFYIGNDMISPAWIQFYTKSGLKGKLYDRCYDSYSFAIGKLKGSLEQLVDNLGNVDEETLKEMASDLLSVMTSNPGREKIKELVKKYISVLNDGVDLNREQIDVVSQLVVNHRRELFDMIKGSIDIFDGDIKGSLINAVSSIFRDDYGIVRATDLVEGAIELNRKEVGDIGVAFNPLVDLIPSNSRELGAEETIQGIPCAKGSYVEYHDNGRLADATLSRDHRVGEFTFKKGTRLMFTEFGTLKSADLLQDQMLGGFMVSAEKPVNFTEFNELSSFFLAGDQQFEKAELQDGMEISFVGKEKRQMGANFIGNAYINRIPAAEASLALGYSENYSGDESQIVNPYDKKYKSDHFSFSGIPNNGRNLDRSRASVLYYPEGQLRALQLARDHKFNGILVPAGSEVEFYENGEIKTLLLGGKAVVGGVELQEDDMVLFGHNDSFIVVCLSSERTVKGVQYERGYPIWLKSSK